MLTTGVSTWLKKDSTFIETTKKKLIKPSCLKKRKTNKELASLCYLNQNTPPWASCYVSLMGLPMQHDATDDVVAYLRVS